MSLADRVRSTVTRALVRLADDGAFGPPAEARAQIDGATGWTVERPKRAEHGDLATNAAMVLTKRLGKPPRAIARGGFASPLERDLINFCDLRGLSALTRREDNDGRAQLRAIVQIDHVLVGHADAAG